MRPGHRASVLTRRSTAQSELVTTSRMVAELLVAGRKLGCMVDVLCVTELLTTENPESEPTAAVIHDSSAVEKAQVPHARKRLAQWATRIWRDPESESSINLQSQRTGSATMNVVKMTV